MSVRLKSELNSVLSSAIVHDAVTSHNEDLNGVDRLKPEIRRALHSLAQNFSGRDAYRMSLSVTSREVLGKLAALEQREIQGFNAYHTEAYGYSYPFVSAGVTIQRYGDSTPKTKLPRCGRYTLHELAFTDVSELHRLLHIR